MMNPFRQLRWQLTFSYTLVTVSALLGVTLILGGGIFTQTFIPENFIDPEQMIVDFLNSRTRSTYLMWSQILSQSPVDTELVRLYLNESLSVISVSDLFRLGALQFSVSTRASIRVLIFNADGILLGTSVPENPFFHSTVGQPFDPLRIPGLQGPLQAALVGDTVPKHLYTILEPQERYVFAGPIFSRRPGEEKHVVGAIAVLFDSVPTQADIPSYLLKIAGRSLIVFLLGAGIMGAIFGAFFANRLAARFKAMSITIDSWSAGDFSRYIADSAGDEISQFARRLNNMAEQLQSLLRQRQDVAVSEERNRLARDLHDSAKQQALAASFELGAALTLYDRDPGAAKKHLTEADALVDSVRKELTSLVDELRPRVFEELEFPQNLKEYALEWSNRSGIELKININQNGQLPLATQETLFRITQEALANLARHSAATCAEVILEYDRDTVTLTINDNGRGFDPDTPHVGMGLNSMRERAAAMGGNFLVESSVGQGVKILVTLPVEF